MVDAGDVGAGLSVVRRRIAAAGGDGVTVVAVTKGFGADAVRAAAAAGLPDVGESYAQELLAKWADLAADDPGPATGRRVHFIGRLQRNKVRALAAVVDLWQSVDRLALGHEIALRAPGAHVLVQVNVAGEDQKGGCPPAGAAELAESLRGLGLCVDGVMGVGPTGPPEAARPGFQRLRRLADELALPVCSMGMSDDLEVAVSEGSTMVRVGTALFGPRPATRARAH